MPKTEASVSACRDPKRLHAIINDFQRQLSACRLRIKELEGVVGILAKIHSKKPGRPKKTQPKQSAKTVETTTNEA